MYNPWESYEFVYAIAFFNLQERVLNAFETDVFFKVMAMSRILESFLRGYILCLTTTN